MNPELDPRHVLLAAASVCSGEEAQVQRDSQERISLCGQVDLKKDSPSPSTTVEGNPGKGHCEDTTGETSDGAGTAASGNGYGLARSQPESAKIARDPPGGQQQRGPPPHRIPPRQEDRHPRRTASPHGDLATRPRLGLSEIVPWHDRGRPDMPVTCCYEHARVSQLN